jgi:hypothetical protein
MPVEVVRLQHLPIERELELLRSHRNEQPSAANGKTAERTVRASTLRLVLTNGLEDGLSYEPDPGGLVLENIKFLGRLDLDDLRIDLPLSFHNCAIEGGISAVHSSLRRLELLDCEIGRRDLGRHSALDLKFARIDGVLNLSGSTVTTTSLPALDARNARITGDVLLRYQASAQPHYRTAEDGEGTISFVFARIGGSVILHGVRVANDRGPAFNISSADVNGDLNFAHACSLSGTSGTGVLQIVGTEINGQLDLGNSTVTNDIGPALNIRGAIITDDLSMKEGFTATGTTDRGVVRLLQAEIGGRVWIRGATIRNDSDQAGSALNCEDIHVKRSFTIQNYGGQQCVLAGIGDSSTIRLSGAAIDGQLAVADVDISNPSGPVFTASQAHISSGLLLRSLTVSAEGTRGAIRLAGTRVDGMLSVDYALIDQAISSDKDKWDVDGLTYTGYPDVATWNTTHGSAVSVVVPKLSRAEPNPSKSFSRWLALLASGTTEYAAQPYQHMAAIAHAAGHDDEARRALKEQRRAQENRGRLSPLSKYWSKFYGFSVGYGYESWRPLVGLAANVVIALVLVFLLVPGSIQPTPMTAVDFNNQVVISPVSAKSPGVCEAGDRLLLSLDIALPLVRLYGDSDCQVEAEPPPLVTFGFVIVQLIGWAAATLFVAGFAGVIRRA